MARSRNIKPGFFKNEELGDLPATFRLFFIGLWCVADREGRLEDRPKRLWAELMPYDPFEGDAALEKLAARHFVVRYEANGVRCIQIKNFTKHQAPHYKEVASEIPAPPGWNDSGTTPGSAPEALRKEILERDGRCIECGSSEDLTLDHIVPRSLGGSHEEENLQTLCRRCNSAKNNRIAKNSGKRQCDDDSTSAQRRPEVGLASIGGEFPLDSLIPGFLDSLIPEKNLEACVPPTPKKRATRLPADWAPTPDQIAWARSERKDINPATEASKFRDYWIAKAGKDAAKLDWDATWRNWVRNAKAAAKAVNGFERAEI